IAICEGESTELVASGDGTYAWSHSSETSASVTVNPITETTYTVTVTNTNNCSASASSTVSVNPNPDIPVATIDCTGGVDQGIITLTSPTGANYEYSIGGTFQASTSFGPLVNGDYTITVNDINTACSSTGSPIDLSCGCINPPTLSLSSTSDQICGISDYVVAGNSFGGSATEVTISHNGNGNLDIASSTTSPFDFTYTPASTDLGGNITITVITNNPDGDPCTPAEQEFTLSVLEIPEINISSNSPVCVGQDINLSEDAGDANVWQWTGPNGFTSSEQNPSILDANLTNEGDYNLTITGNNSCTNSATITINVNNNPTINASNDGPVCEGTDIQLFATGSEDVNYLWTGPNSFTSTEQNPILTNTLVNQEGDYTVLVIDPVTNCLASAITEVIINENPDIPTANIDCISGLGQITITSPLGADYEYSIGSSFQANTIFENLDNGNYTIIVNNVNTNCSSVSEVLTIDCGCTNEPSLTLSENTGEICGNQAFTLDGNSFGGSATQVNITHNGSGEIDETNITSSDFSFTYTPSSEDYGNTVIITIITDNPQGEPCQVASATFSLDVLDIPNIIANNSSPICKGEDIDLTESGNEAISWSWTGPNGFNSDMQNPTITEADVFANGTYTVTGTDAKGCTNSATTIVIVSIPTEITFVEYLCADTLPIFLNANIQGGTWSGNGIIDANTGEFDPEIAGDGEHTITYTLLNPCGNTTTTTIRVYPRANAEILPVDTLFLSDLPIFVETVEAGGIWSGTAIDEIIGEFTPNIAGIGDHQVFYTIEEPCGDIDSTIIIVIPDIIPDLLIPDVLTPNNDGYNDTWRIQGIQAFEKIEIYIFNRWGDEVFTYTGSGFDYHDPAKQWDGTYKGKLLPFGTYVYVLILENETSYKGTISLIR
ncbi:MAG: gliding motility-associated C-terminal domain-containing protein, partial [Bacteroidales bacterium]|nr:gliding motility-associated C-terminal domain-containing protein [Bacteroidales bacterium]